MQIVIPMAGDSQRFKEYGFDQPKYLIEVLGKTLLERSLSSLPLHLANRLIFIIKQEHEDEYRVCSKIEEILDKLVKQPFEQWFVFLDQSTRGQTETVLKAKEYLDPVGELIIFNIDTQFEYDWEGVWDAMNDHEIIDGLILAVEKEGEQWSFAKTGEDGYVKQTAEKERISNNALVGFYHFTQAQDFIKAAEDQLNNNKTTKGEFYVAPLYNFLIEKGERFIVRNVKSFIPLGTPEEVFDFIRSQTKPTQPRSFNEIKIEGQIVFKFSKNKFKMGGEYAWLERMSQHFFLKKYIPIPFVLESTYISMERIPAPSLSEIFLYQKLSQEDIEKIFYKLFQILFNFKYFCNPIPLEGVLDLEGFWSKIYIQKTAERVHKIRFGNLVSKELYNNDFKINGKTVVGLNILEQKTSLLQELADDIIPAYFHGDFCLPNILYSLEYDVAKLIDPRGELVGDQRYDLAKLRHSFSGYDLIINDYYELIEVRPNEFEYNIFWNHNINKKTLTLLDNKIIEYTSLDTFRQILIIEALLFLTMIPLHDEDPKRQKMFYILAMEKFTNLTLINESI